jgi:hypothetical protein
LSWEEPQVLVIGALMISLADSLLLEQHFRKSFE